MEPHDFSVGVDAALLSSDEPLVGKVGDADVLMVRHGGRACALAARCTHAGAALADGLIVGGELRCPWHHARFAIETGEAIAAPAFAALDRYHVVEEDGLVRVTGRMAPPRGGPAPRDVGRVVIVGGGAGGHALAEWLTRAGAGDRVTILSADDDPPYDRTACSKNYLAGEMARDDIGLPPLPRGLRTGVVATRIDLAARVVELTDGERIPYDTLVLATGSEPVVPEFDGDDRDDVHVLRTLRDADALIAAAHDAEAAVVIGSSFVGLEAAASLRKRGLSVSIVSSADLPLADIVGPELGAMLRALHEAEGVAFHLGRRIARWDGRAATLDDGTRIDAALLVAGTGVAPRVDLARGAGLAIAEATGGIAVDATLRASAPRVYAIGDIASVPDPRLGRPIRVEHWLVAQRMGQWLARHLLGETTEAYRAVPFFWSGQYDANLRYVGHAESIDERTVDGALDGGDGIAVTLREGGVECALATAGRDRLALETEAAWEGAARS